MNEQELAAIEPLHEDPGLPEELRSALAGYRRIEPAAELREALWMKVEREARSPWSRVPLRVVLGVAVVGAVLALWPAKPDSPRTAKPVVVVPAVAPPVAPTVAPEVAPAVVPEVESAVVPVESVRVHKPRRTRAQATEAPPAPDVAAELALLARAKRSLALDPPRALALTVEHAELFPDGALTEEREVIAIEALARSGQREPAERRAEQFRAAYPRSTHLARLEVVLAAP